MLQSLSNYSNYEFHHNTQLNNFDKCSHKVHFSRRFFRKNISDFNDLHFNDLHNEKKSIWMFHVSQIVSAAGIPVNIYQIS